MIRASRANRFPNFCKLSFLAEALCRSLGRACGPKRGRMISMTNQAREFRELLAQGQVACLGAYDAMTARVAENAGAKAVYVSGYAAAAVRLGKPDLGLISQ